MNQWRDCYSKAEREYSERFIAPVEFLKENGFGKFSWGKENVNMIIHICKTGRRKAQYPRPFGATAWPYPPNLDEAPYIDHAYFYKAGRNAAALVYHPYIQYEKSIFEMANDIVMFWKNLGMNVWVLRKSWYSPDALLVMVTYPFSWMSDPKFKYDVPWYGSSTKRMLRYWNQFAKDGYEEVK